LQQLFLAFTTQCANQQHKSLALQAAARLQLATAARAHEVCFVASGERKRSETRRRPSTGCHAGGTGGC